MTFGQPVRPDVSPHYAWQPGVGTPPQGPQPEYWLKSGPALPKRTWQRSTRTPVIIVSTLVALLLAAVAVVALLVGTVSRTSFTAHGVVVCPQTFTTDSRIAPGVAVRIYDETGHGLGHTTLGAPEPYRGLPCVLPFSVHSVQAGKSGYVVRIGDALQDTVSQAALKSTVVLRPLS